MPRATNARRDDDAEAFFPDPSRTGSPTVGGDAEFFAEEFLASVTSGENVEQDAADEVTDEEVGGPFVEESLVDLDDLPDPLPEPSFQKIL